MESNLLKNEFQQFVDLYLEGNADGDQKRLVESYFELFAQQPDVLDELSDLEISVIDKRLHDMISNNIQLRRSVLNRNQRYFYVIMTVFLIAGGLFIYHNKVTGLNDEPLIQAAIKPGSNRATLTLSDGTGLVLDSNYNELPGDKFPGMVFKTERGLLSYKNIRVNDLRKSSLNRLVLSTPRGGQYRVILPDGTKVWLNAASSLIFPVVFDEKERTVHLSGEAYFEVAKRVSLPFTVCAKGLQIRVLGTHFNLSAYPEEPISSTTLLEGSVIIVPKAGTTLKRLLPGEQAVVDEASGSVIVTKADTEGATAWKDGYFSFDNESLETILRKLERWYDVTVCYDNQDLRKLQYTGILSRNKDIAQVLRKFELTNTVKFRIKGRIITAALN
ncbi:FecR family protein [Pedobacter antarcticus]|uniref:FecR family protein n=1 Tax=Pedobacter antarcticus TaxID=34086 RepID=UPI000892635E|nr:FecR domain-containing protein [Pedobacter antarcticus]SDL79861.1 FecR family protein [Pedobacter antarcticus]